MAYLGNTPTTQNFISGTDYFNGDGATTAFTLSRTVNSVNDIQVTVNNVVQQPNDAYTLSGTTLTMTSAPSAGTNNVYVRYLSTTTQVITPSQNTVSWNTLDSNIQQDLGVMYKNRIINGNMVIDQRNAGAAVTADGSYPVDRFRINNNTDGAFSAQQDTSTPSGFNNSIKITTTTADATLTTTQNLHITQRIEGFNTADLMWGTANAKTVTLSFWVRSSLTGTFGGAIMNSASNRAYPFTYTISVADTWEQKSVTIAGDASGTWLTTNGIGIRVIFGLGVGPDRSGTAGAWNSNNNLSATGAVSVIGTLNATWYITGVQLEVGTQATAFSTAGGSYGAELQLCQRYYYQVTAGSDSFTQFGLGRAFSGTEGNGIVHFAVPMRAKPTFAFLGVVGNYDFSPTAINGGSVPASNTHMTIGMTFSSISSGSAFVLGQNSTSTPCGFTFSAEL